MRALPDAEADLVVVDSVEGEPILAGAASGVVDLAVELILEVVAEVSAVPTLVVAEWAAVDLVVVDLAVADLVEVVLTSAAAGLGEACHVQVLPADFIRARSGFIHSRHLVVREVFGREALMEGSVGRVVVSVRRRGRLAENRPIST